jgi:hypothetical protein
MNIYLQKGPGGTTCEFLEYDLVEDQANPNSMLGNIGITDGMYGNTGKFFDKFKVYSRKTDPDNNPVTKITAPDGRSVYYVESIQKLNYIRRTVRL